MPCKNWRVLRLGMSILLAAPVAAFAATPASGTLTTTSGPQTSVTGPFFVANPTPVPVLDSSPECGGVVPATAQPCDNYALTVTLPAGYSAQYPMATVRVSLGWTDAGAGVSDYDLYVYKGVVTTTTGSETPLASSATSANPEIASFSVVDGSQTYSIKAVPYTPSGESPKITVTLVPGAAATTGSGGSSGGTASSGPAVSFGGPSAPAPAAPRYQVFAPDAANENTGQQNGEYSIGFNPKTGNIMAFSITFPGHIYRVTPPEVVSTTAPESCDATWTDKSSLWAGVPQVVGDPILWTDQDTGRTFEGNLTVGPNVSYAFSDNDGDTWTNVGISGIAGADHETLVSGPYPAGSPFATIAQTRGYVGADGKGRAVYYCSQNIASGDTVSGYPAGTAGYNATDTCVRSDDGGQTWGPIQIASNGATCGGLHGHIHVAPDGTAYLPIKGCGTQQGGTYTTDAGDSWTQFQVPGTVRQPNGSDPSIGIDAANKLYYCYVNSDGHAHVKVGQKNADNTLSWGKDSDIGIASGVANAAFPEAIGGDSGRAACGFLGTNDASPNYQALDFKGAWYLFVATTYDGGDTWTTVNATPNDPVQGAGGIWQQGGSNQNRNLLDFNEVTMDSKGRVLFGYDDGCVTGTCVADPSQNDFAARMRVVRQTGGKSLKAAFDGQFAAAQAPGRACLSGTTASDGVHLNWKVPDHGGSSIASYTVTRTPSSGGSPTTFQTTKNSFVDAGASGTGYVYSVKATNTTGTGAASNAFSPAGAVQGTETACATPGITVVTDPSGDDKPPLPTAGSGQGDILSVQIAEPDSLSGDLVFTMKVRSLASLPPNVDWYITFLDQAGKKWFVAMQTDETSTATYSYGDYNATQSSLSQTIGTLEAGSGYSASTGAITLIVKKSEVGSPSAGKTLTQVQGATYQLVGVSAVGGSLQTIDTTATGSYTLRAANACMVNTAPTAVLVYTPTSGITTSTDVKLDGSASSDPDSGDSVVSYSFQYDGTDGSGTYDVVDSASPTVTHRYTTAGDHLTFLKVKDSHGLESSPVFQKISVASSGGGTGGTSGGTTGGSTGGTSGGTTGSGTLTASLTTTTPTSGQTPLSVGFDASGTTDTDSSATITSYYFFPGDCQCSIKMSTPTWSYTYSAAGNFTAQVVAGDSAGRTSASNTVAVSATASITVTPGGPNAVAQMVVTPTSGSAPLTVMFDGSRSVGANGNAISTYTYDFGDGSAKVSGSNAKVSHVYLAPGSFTPSLSVTDTQGNNSPSKAQAKVQVIGSGTTPGGTGGATSPAASGGSGGGGGGLGILVLLPLLALRGRRRSRH